ncbi:hypothetical protein ACRRVA_00305 [Candidatus Cardinium hertigii]|uniref:hypothetical protein n=1 Tax=Candidatus Cardinium hertigii TaxID=247481 RepID=UPI003D7D3808
MNTTHEKDQFWLSTPLEEMTPAQWESLCDECGKCCLLKIQEAETQQVRTTKICCRLLNTPLANVPTTKNDFAM